MTDFHPIKSEPDFYEFREWCQKNKINGVENELSTLENMEISPNLLPTIIEFYNSQKDLNQFDQRALNNFMNKKQQNHEISVTVSEKDEVYGVIRNGTDGVFSQIKKFEQENRKGEIETKTRVFEIFRFNGSIGPVIKIDGEKIGIRYDINGETGMGTIDEVRAMLRRKFSLTPAKVQSMTEILYAFALSEAKSKKLEILYSNHIHVGNDGIIACTYQKEFNIREILQALSDFLPHSTHPDALLSSISRNLLSPLHFEIKKRVGIVTKIPFGLLQGTTGAGKTPISELVMARGYDQKRDEWFFQYENVKTFFALMKHLTTSNLPCLYSDVNGAWLYQNKESFKSYSQSGNIASRGTSEQTLNEYVGYRTFDIDTNSTVRPDDDAALSGRFSSYLFTNDNKRRVDRKKFLDFIKNVPFGFMYGLFRECFAGKSIEQIIAEVEGFERATQWEDYGVQKLNELCEKYGINKFSFQRIGSTSVETNAENVAYAFIDQYFKDHEESEDYDPKTDMNIHRRKNIPMFSDNQARVMEERDNFTQEDWYIIYFQPSAYETLVGKLGLQVPYRKAAEFMSNIIETDKIKILFDGKTSSQRMDEPRKVYGLKVRK